MNETSRLLYRLGKKIDGIGACCMTTDISATHESYMMMADMCNADAEDLLGLILFFLRDETDFEFYIGGKLEQIKILVCASCLCKMKNTLAVARLCFITTPTTEMFLLTLT